MDDMARPRKELGSWAVPSDFYEDVRVRRLIDEYGGDGFMILSFIMTKIYKADGYVLWDDNFKYAVKYATGKQIDEVERVVDFLVKVSFFDESSKRKGYLSSQDIIEDVRARCSKERIMQPDVPEALETKEITYMEELTEERIEALRGSKAILGKAKVAWYDAGIKRGVEYTSWDRYTNQDLNFLLKKIRLHIGKGSDKIEDEKVLNILEYMIDNDDLWKSGFCTPSHVSKYFTKYISKTKNISKEKEFLIPLTKPQDENHRPDLSRLSIPLRKNVP